MARIGLNTTVSGLTGKLIIRWVKASAPLAEVGRLPAKNFPYDGVDNLINLNRVVYVVQWWRSDDGVTLDQLIKDWAIDASLVNVATLVTYQYQVDRGWDNTAPVATGPEVWADPADTDTELTDERIDGAAKEEMIVHQSGYGRLLDAEYELKPGGGITLNFGKTFDADVAWSITVSSVDATALDPGPGDTSGLFAGVEILTADQDFDSLVKPLANKLVIANWATTVGTVTFGSLDLIPDNTHVTFQTEQGAQNYLKLQFNPGDTVRYLNADVNVIYLPKCETISLFFFDGVCYVTDIPKRALLRGKVDLDYSPVRPIDTLTGLLADEATGVLNAADYPGLYAYILTLTTGVVPLGAGVGQWSYNSAGVYPNKRNYGLDAGAGTFRVPHLAGLAIKLNAAASGVYEADNVGSFTGNLTVPKGYSYTGAPNNDRLGNGDPNHPANVAIPFTYTAVIPETRVKSFSQIPYVIL